MRTYTHTFKRSGRRWICTFDVSLTGTEMSWSPVCPPETVAIWREYRRWRDRCLGDFGRRTGVYHKIRVDIPQAGLRDRFTYAVSPEAAYAYARATYGELSKCEVSEVQRDTRDRMLRELSAAMLANAPVRTVQ
jgi:hypothetical protein